MNLALCLLKPLCSTTEGDVLKQKILSIFVLILINLACGGGGGGGSSNSSSEFPEVEMKLQVNLNDLDNTREKSRSTKNDVVKVIGQLSSQEGFVMSDITFEKNDSDIWISDALKLPSGQTLSLGVIAYDDSEAEIFNGQLEFIPAEDVNLVVPVKAVDDLINSTPSVVSLSIPSEVGPGETVQLLAHARDADGDELSYLWTFESGSAIGVSTANIISWKAPEEEGEASFSFLVFDGVDQTQIDFDISIGYQGQGQIELVFLPVVTGFEAYWVDLETLQILANVSQEDEKSINYIWLNHDDEVLSESNSVVLEVSEETLSSGLKLSVGYQGVDARAVFEYALDEQTIPVIEYID